MEMSAPRYEYLVDAAPASYEEGFVTATRNEVMKWLNQQASEGWRLVSVTEDRFNCRTFYFERRLET